MSSSVPSVEFEIPHFLNDLTTISSGRSRHASKTYEATVVNEATLTFPARVKLFSASTIQVVHLSRTRSFNGLFRQTSSGWRTLVNPPGMTATSVLVWRSARFTGSARWARKACQISKLLCLGKPPCRELRLSESTASCRLHPSSHWNDDVQLHLAETFL